MSGSDEMGFLQLHPNHDSMFFMLMGNSIVQHCPRASVITTEGIVTAAVRAAQPSVHDDHDDQYQGPRKRTQCGNP
jgi:hypothetical protein